MNSNDLKPHIKLAKNPRYRRALVCGAPERAALIAQRLKKLEPLAKNREYHSYIGEYDEAEVMVVSHGVGAPGAAICFQELIDCGVRSIIRLGTAGALQDELGIGSLVIANAAIRRDGLSKQMVPSEYPAVASHRVTSELMRSLDAKKTPYACGTILTADLFYPGHLDGKLKFYSKAGALAVEMECSALFIIGAMRKVETGAVVVCDGNPMKWEEGVYDPTGQKMKAGMDLAIDRCLAAIARC
jgi:uridine phosphorylase